MGARKGRGILIDVVRSRVLQSRTEVDDLISMLIAQSGEQRVLHVMVVVEAPIGTVKLEHNVEGVVHVREHGDHAAMRLPRAGDLACDAVAERVHRPEYHWVMMLEGGEIEGPVTLIERGDREKLIRGKMVFCGGLYLLKPFHVELGGAKATADVLPVQVLEATSKGNFST